MRIRPSASVVQLPASPPPIVPGFKPRRARSPISFVSSVMRAGSGGRTGGQVCICSSARCAACNAPSGRLSTRARRLSRSGGAFPGCSGADCRDGGFAGISRSTLSLSIPYFRKIPGTIESSSASKPRRRCSIPIASCPDSFASFSARRNARFTAEETGRSTDVGEGAPRGVILSISARIASNVMAGKPGPTEGCMSPSRRCSGSMYGQPN